MHQTYRAQSFQIVKRHHVFFTNHGILNCVIFFDKQKAKRFYAELETPSKLLFESRQDQSQIVYERAIVEYINE